MWDVFVRGGAAYQASWVTCANATAPQFFSPLAVSRNQRISLPMDIFWTAEGPRRAFIIPYFS